MQTSFLSRATAALAALAALVALGALGGCDSATGPARVARVEVAPATPGVTALVVGETMQLSATPLDAAGNPLSGREVVFSSSDEEIATVGAASGLVTAVSAGDVVITATADGIDGDLELVIEPVPVADIEVAPDPLLLHPEWTEQLAVELTDADGNVLTGREVTFATANENVARVSASGLVTGWGTGTTAITVSSGGVSVDVPVEVSPAAVHAVTVEPATLTMSDGTQQRVFPVARDARGNELGGRTVSWSSSDEDIATVLSSGLVSAVRPGEAEIRATIEGVTGAAVVTVQPHVARIVVAPTAATLRIGEEAQLTIRLEDESGNELTGRIVSYSQSDPGVVTLPTDGRVRAMDEGTSTLTIRSEGATATVEFTVLQPVVFVSVSPRIATVPVGTQMQLTVVVQDMRGQPLEGRVVTYSSSNTVVASVSEAGLVSGLAKGVATITVTSEGVSQTAQITVP
ncbi:MAG TPA: Ig-like domain-containing protein [Gemmatimonadaceae bacterium]